MVAYLWYFYVYAFLGWCTEVCFAAVNSGRFVNRGFLNGPLCPMYGVGVAAIVFCLTPLEGNAALVFLGSVALTTVLEGVTGLLLEKLFHQRWWDYSNLPFNLGGYVCLKFSLLWGLACLLILKVVHPGVEALVLRIPPLVSAILLPLFSAALLCDTVFTVLSVRSLNLRLEQLAKITGLIRAASDGIGERMSDFTLNLIKRQEELLAHQRAGERRLLAAFPQMRSIRHGEMLEKVKERLATLKKKI